MPEELAVAATVVLLRDGSDGLEVLLLERPRDRGSFAGAWVFPGGRVDPEDWPRPPDEEAAARAAAVREVREETGLEVHADALVVSALWTPPENVPRRFRTWFFAARAPAGDIVLTAEESVDFSWMRPATALARHGSGELSLVPPTWVTLHGLQHEGTAASVLARLRASARRDYSTRLGSAAGGPVLLWGEDVAYLDDTRIEAPGARHRLEIGTLPWVYSQPGD